MDARADEFFAVFERVDGAVEVALSIQKAMRDRAWPDDVEVRLRVGIHTGSPTLTETGYVGMPVHVAARVLSAARGRQVLLSAAAHGALVGSLPDGVSARSLGRQRLRGMPDPVELFELVAESLSPFDSPRILDETGPSVWSGDHAGNLRPES